MEPDQIFIPMFVSALYRDKWMTLISNKDLKERGLEGPFSNLLPHHMSDFTYCFLLSLAVFVYKRVHWTPLPLDRAANFDLI